MRPLDFGEVARCVIPTTNTLLASRPIQLNSRIISDLPPVLADAEIKIPDDNREEVFEMLHDGPVLVEASNEAIGPGLTFSKEIVELHGGKIALDNHARNGMAFTIALPVADWSDNSV